MVVGETSSIGLVELLLALLSETEAQSSSFAPSARPSVDWFRCGEVLADPNYNSVSNERWVRLPSPNWAGNLQSSTCPQVPDKIVIGAMAFSKEVQPALEEHYLETE